MIRWLPILLLVGCGPSYKSLRNQVATGADAFAIVDGSCDGFEADEGCQRFIAEACEQAFHEQRADAGDLLARGDYASAVSALVVQPHRTCPTGREEHADALEEIKALRLSPAEALPARLATLGERAREGRLKRAPMYQKLLTRNASRICAVHQASVEQARPTRWTYDVPPGPWVKSLEVAAHWCGPKETVALTEREAEALTATDARSTLWAAAACVPASRHLPGLAARCAALGDRLAELLPALEARTATAAAARIAVAEALATQKVASLELKLAEFVAAQDAAREGLARAERAVLSVEADGSRFGQRVAAAVKAAPELAKLGVSLDGGSFGATVRIAVEAPPDYDERSSTSYGHSRYLAGTRWVNNPDYFHKNAACERERREYDDCLREYALALERLRICKEEVFAKQRQRQRCMSAGKGYCPSVYDNCTEPRQCDSRDSSYACDALARTPPQIEEEVWADHRYPIRTFTASMRTSLSVEATLARGTEARQQQRAEVSVSASDTTVDGDSTRNVPHDPLDLPSRQALTARLAKRAGQRTVEVLRQAHTEACAAPGTATDVAEVLAESVRRQAWGCEVSGLEAQVDAVLGEVR